jgi:hypothetical protein
MASEKQIKANRANAKHSTGPRTVPGKRKSSLNSLKLGTFAKSSLLPTEDPKEFSTFARGLYADWEPVGTTERTLVELLISTLWRSRRLQTVEVGLYQMYRIYKEVDGGLATAFVQDGLQVDSFARLVKCESNLERRFLRIIQQLERFQKERLGQDG